MRTDETLTRTHVPRCRTATREELLGATEYRDGDYRTQMPDDYDSRGSVWHNLDRYSWYRIQDGWRELAGAWDDFHTAHDTGDELGKDAAYDRLEAAWRRGWTYVRYDRTTGRFERTEDFGTDPMANARELSEEMEYALELALEATDLSNAQEEAE